MKIVDASSALSRRITSDGHKQGKERREAREEMISLLESTQRKRLSRGRER